MFWVSFGGIQWLLILWRAFCVGVVVFVDYKALFDFERFLAFIY